MVVMLSLGVGITVFLCVCLLVMPVLLRPSQEAQRVLQSVSSTRLDQRVVRPRERFEEALLRVSQGLRGRMGMKVSSTVQERLRTAGFRGAGMAELFFAVQIVLPLCGAFAGTFVVQNKFFSVLAFTAAGYVLPNMWLTWQTNKRLNRMRKGLPDAIDLLVICVDAGLGIDQALLRVNEELGSSHPDIQEEFNRVHLEQRAGQPRLDSWSNMAKRVQVPEITSFVSMLTQAERFGTPILKSLSTFADDLRLRRRQRSEEAAAKTKVKIIFPLVFCILPSLFIVLLAPAVLAMSRAFAGVGK